VGGRAVTRPGETLEAATIVIRDGFFVAVGKEVAIPEDAQVWDMKGTTIYAGLIDPYLALVRTNPPSETAKSEPVLTSGASQFFGVPGQQLDPGNPGPGADLVNVTPQYRV